MNESEKQKSIHIRCEFRDCHNCCLDTQMILTNEDLSRIEKSGHSRKEFCLPRSEPDNFWQLRNINGRCFFLDNEGRCTIYSIRPFGCRVYPLVYEPSDDDILIDEDCREVVWFSKQKYEEEQVNFVRELGKTLIKEAKRE